MACLHVNTCPLFPYLNASLDGWRDAYCDTEGEWASCARYQVAARGEPVPLALLPNGRMPVAMLPEGARHRADPEPGTDLLPTFGVAWERRPERQGWWTRLARWMRAAA